MSTGIKRRAFIAGVGGAVAIGSWPLAAHAQQAAMPVIGFMRGTSPETFAPYKPAFLSGLREAGFIEGQNVEIVYRWAEGQYERLPAFAADLVRRRVAVIVASGGESSSIAAKAATTSIPIVFGVGSDPVKLGLVASLNRPDGNLTGVWNFAQSLGSKRLELLRELSPKADLVGVIYNPRNPASVVDLGEVEVVARALGQKINVVSASIESEIEPAFASLIQAGAGALVVMGDPFLSIQRTQIIPLAAKHHLPAIYEWRDITAAGGLMSYGGSLNESTRQLGIYTGKILKGTKPADLPVMQAVKVELVLNLKTAKTLGVTFPLTLLGRADGVIE